MRRTAGLILLLSAAVTAGCGGLVGSQLDGQGTLTPVPVPSDGTPASESDGRIAPGLTTDGIVDPERLLRTHADRLENTSYAFHRRVSRRNPDGSIRSTSETVIHDDESAVRVRHARTVYRGGNRTVTRVDRWTAGDETYTAITRDNETTYEVAAVASGGKPLETTHYSESLTQILAHLPVAVGPPAEVEGTTVYPLEVTERRDVYPLRNVSFVGNVTERGLVTEYRLEYEVRHDGTPIRVTVRRAVSTGRTTVARPDWLPNAVNATS